jgi:hypothetical protein
LFFRDWQKVLPPHASVFGLQEDTAQTLNLGDVFKRFK